MEPTYSLQSHLFNDLGSNTYRDINIHNPLHIQHPPNGTSNLPPEPDLPPYQNYLDDETSSPNGDGDPNSIHLLVPQDCAGFNLGSFFVRRSAWTDRLLDIWWDPVFYEQKHMEWEHKEQDALEYIYANQPWIRKHVGFVPQRKINAFPNGACGDDLGLPPVGGCKAILAEAARLERIGQSTAGLDFRECGVKGVHYQEHERDFLVNMAGSSFLFSSEVPPPITGLNSSSLPRVSIQAGPLFLVLLLADFPYLSSFPPPPTPPELGSKSPPPEIFVVPNGLLLTIDFQNIAIPGALAVTIATSNSIDVTSVTLPKM
ncbi:hypothetical protein D0866_08987 [Hortaea werneckii]|uniref:Uncharacterized protein n=1 Tax=Hortaea werneckii TaxID=91943 RepID=A0A3M7ANG5_HORWE|nr:hypothetical protein D0866_08987 [Hortaea werneckii]